MNNPETPLLPISAVVQQMEVQPEAFPETKPEGKIDRRIQKTRKALRAALIELIVEKGYDDLSIQAIADRADVRRATFYLHYRDKEALLADILSDIAAGLVRDLEQELSNDEAYRLLLQHVDKNQTLYRHVFASQDGRRFAQKLQDSIARQVKRGMEQAKLKLSVPPEVLAQYMAGAEIAMLMWWLENDRPYPPDELADHVYRLVLEGVARIAGINLDRN